MGGLLSESPAALLILTLLGKIMVVVLRKDNRELIRDCLSSVYTRRRRTNETNTIEGYWSLLDYLLFYCPQCVNVQVARHLDHLYTELFVFHLEHVTPRSATIR
jgi:hypothetical protein